MSTESSSNLIDSFGRTVNNLRISVTDRCNFRCRYCMPEEGMVWLQKRELLTFEEITRCVHVFAGLGVTKLRLTGGEPLMRNELNVLVDKLNRVPGIQDIALTTNGFFLAEQALQLHKAGLRRINVSMDSLDPKTFSSMVRRDYLHKVWEGLDVLEKLPVRPIKVNVVLVRGINDHEIEAFARLARTKPFVIRFIEFMPIGADDGWSNEKVIPTREVIERISAMGFNLVPVRRHREDGEDLHKVDEPSDRYTFEDGLGEIGFISSVSQPFCGDCTRARLSADGHLYTCLFATAGRDLRPILRSGAGDEELAALLAGHWREREDRYSELRAGGGRRAGRVEMSYIGG